MNKKILSLLLFLLSFINLAHAEAIDSTSQTQQFINNVMQKYHLSNGYVRSILAQAHYNPEVIQRIDHPYEVLAWYKYQQLFLTPDRITDGIIYWNQSKKLLNWEEREYEVPANIILAILGIETKYGQNVGNFKVLDALNTLAFYYPVRASFFQDELAAFIALVKAYKFDPDNIYGSYAGAMGQPQFMPSTLLNYGVNFSEGTAAPNIFSDKADVIFSVGNYLRQHGWEPEEPVATLANVSGNEFEKILKRDPNQLQIPSLSLAQIAQYGVTPAEGQYDPRLKANLIALQAEHGTEYWLTFNNFYVITTYNSSDLYAMATYQLGKTLEKTYIDKYFSKE